MTWAVFLQSTLNTDKDNCTGPASQPERLITVDKDEKGEKYHDPLVDYEWVYSCFNMRFLVLTLLWFARVQLRVADTCPWLVTVCLLGSLNMQSYNITLTYARKHPWWTWQLSAHSNEYRQINSRVYKSIPLCLTTIDSKEAPLVVVYIYNCSRTDHYGSITRYIITLKECWGENIHILNQLNGNWLQPAECMFPAVCFLHRGQD